MQANSSRKSRQIQAKEPINHQTIVQGIAEAPNARTITFVDCEKTFRVEELVLVVVFTLSLKELLAYLNINIEK